MGLASKIQAAGPRPGAAGAAPQAYGQPASQQQAPQQQAYGQQPPQQQQRPPQQQSSYGQQPQPPYPTQDRPAQAGVPPPQGARPAGYGAGQPSSNPYAGQPPQQQQAYGQAPQSQSGQAPQYQYGQAPQQAARPAQGQYGQAPPQQGQYGQAPQPQGQYGQAPPQQGQYGQAAPQAAAGLGPAGGAIAETLRRIVRENRLEIFYPAQRLQQVIQRAESIDFRGLSAAWDIPMEIATDLASLALYDVVLYCDDSGSMRAEERGERIDDLKLILSRVSEVCTLFDDDGIQVRFMNSDVQGNGIRNAQQAAALIEQVRFSGITPLATQLDRKVIQPLVMQQIRSQGLQKPVLVVVITDGEPVGEPRDLVKRVIGSSANAVAQAGFPGAIRYQFAQVGKDMKAQAYLSELDSDPQIGKMIDAISYFELEAQEYERKNGVILTPDLWLVKLCVGAIDASYDEADE